MHVYANTYIHAHIHIPDGALVPRINASSVTPRGAERLHAPTAGPQDPALGVSGVSRERAEASRIIRAIFAGKAAAGNGCFEYGD